MNILRKFLNWFFSSGQASTDMSADRQNIIDNLLHANEFTNIENTSAIYLLRGWFGALGGDLKGLSALKAGDDAWAFTVLFEHYVSTLPAVVKNRTPLQLKVFALLKAKAESSQEALDAILGASSDEDERMNVETDAFVKSVIAKL